MSAICDLPTGSDASSEDPPDLPLPGIQNIYPPLPNFTSSSGPRPSSIPFPVVSGPTAPNTPLPNQNPPRNDEPRISVLPDSPQPTAASPGQAANPPMDSIPQIPANARPDSNIPPEILGSLMQEQLCRTGLENLDGDLLKYMLMALLSSRASQKIKSGPALSLVSNQLKWQQLGSELCSQLLILDGSNFPSWSAALVDTVSCVTTNPRYLDQDLLASNQPTLNGVFAVIKFSIDAFLRPLLNGIHIRRNIRKL
ncbi:hypothetical protein PCANC_06744 [Puccinia coronata f. sp. avenae]|uniref:Uncharacterized protein n=1 Tax=Puccinia coronata f. sp. avenae TaxID=200324 RepID=A0A2N5VDQ3_9BASI|nr:hypothetical protein PCANC_06744 [Puccinia coronata f. sp. avenae]